MKSLPLSEVKMKLSKIVDSVSKTDSEITITKNGRAAAVLISADAFESWKETIEILSDMEMMTDIKKGLGRLKKTKKLYSLEELMK